MAKRILDPRQHDLFKPEATWRPPVELPTHIINQPIVSLDTETNDPELKERGPSWFRGGGHLAGVSLGWEGGSTYLPIGHDGGDNIDKEATLAWLKYFLQNYNGTLVLMNCMYDIGWLRSSGININYDNIILWDVMMVEALLDEHKLRYNLDSIAKTYGLQPKDEALLTEAAHAFGCDPKGGLWRLPARFVGPYAEQDARLPLQIYNIQKKLVAEQGLDKVVQLEHDLIPLLVEMRFRGVRVDVSKAEELYDSFMGEFNQHVLEIKNQSGLNVDVWSADSCAKVFNQLSVNYPRTGSGKPSFTDEWLTSHQSPVAALISKARKAHKAANTFCKGYVLDMADKNGRVHAEFHPLRSDSGGTVSGRFSSSNPNLQNIPARDPVMNTLIRGLFLPEDGELWCAADYSQQEPRLTIHYAAAGNFSRGVESAEHYTVDPDTDYHSFVAKLANIDRKPAKMINLGLAYGMGGSKLCHKLGLPTIMKTGYNGQQYETAGPEGQAILDKYFEAVPFVRELADTYKNIANNTGAIRTLSGRLCRFPYWEPRSGGRAELYEEAAKKYGANNIRRAFTHTALNRKIQGGSADMIKISLRNLWREGLVPLVTVHDENGISVPDHHTAKKVAEIMRTCVQLRVPMKVDVDIGKSWGLAKPMTEEDLDEAA